MFTGEFIAVESKLIYFKSATLIPAAICCASVHQIERWRSSDRFSPFSMRRVFSPFNVKKKKKALQHSFSVLQEVMANRLAFFQISSVICLSYFISGVSF